jgi:hypothetical protein
MAEGKRREPDRPLPKPEKQDRVKENREDKPPAKPAEPSPTETGHPGPRTK